MFEFIFSLWANAKNQINAYALTHSDKVIKGFMYYNYYCVVVGNWLDQFKKYWGFQKMRFILPSDPTYWAVVSFFSTMGIEENDKKYHLLFETCQVCTASSTKPALIMYKKNDIIQCWLSHNWHLPSPDTQQVKSPFINIVYHHTKMQKPLTLRIDHMYLYSGNDILSAEHVFLLLNTEYDADQYVFDLSYSLKIMDSNCKVFYLKSDQWINLTDTKYQICSYQRK